MITIFSVFWFNEINSFVTVFLLKEIDAITAPQPTAPVGASAPPPTPPRPEPKESDPSLGLFSLCMYLYAYFRNS